MPPDQVPDAPTRQQAQDKVGAREYMAAERPVISTPTGDMVRVVGNSVSIGHSTVEFIDACERALSETPQQSTQRRLRLRRRVAGLSWDNTAVAMMNMIEHAPDRRSGAVTRPAPADAGIPVSAAMLEASGPLMQPCEAP